LSGPAVFVVNNSTEVYVRQKTQRSFWPYGAVDKSVINRPSVKEEVREPEVYGDISSEETTSNIYREISTLATFFSIACLQLYTTCIKGDPWNFAIIFRVDKLEWCGYIPEDEKV